MSNISFHRCDENVTGVIDVEVNEKLIFYQVALTGAGQVTIEVKAHTQSDDESRVTVDLGWLPVADGVVDLSSGVSEPVLIPGFIDRIQLTGTGAFNYSITGGE